MQRSWNGSKEPEIFWLGSKESEFLLVYGPTWCFLIAVQQQGGVWMIKSSYTGIEKCNKFS